MDSADKAWCKHFYGWLSYAFASEVFVVVSLTLFLPICLEQFARDNGYLLPDKATPCNAITQTAEAARCVVKVGWVWVDSASFSLYTTSISVAIQALTVISVGTIADNPAHRKRLLLSFAAIGFIPASLFLLLPSSPPPPFSSLWLLASPLAMFANVGFGVSVVAMNSYLPMLAKTSPEVRAAHDIDDGEESGHDSMNVEGQDEDGRDLRAPLLPPATHLLHDDIPSPYHKVLSMATSRISSQGIALGYGAGIILLLLTLILTTTLHGSTFSLRLAVGLSGIWWALFSIPAGVLLPREVRSVEEADSITVSEGIKISWVRLVTTLHPREISRLRNTFKYLAAWFLLSDGFTTITSTAMLFGKTTLGMGASQLVIVGVLTPLCGIAGSIVWPIAQRKVAATNLQIVTTLVILCSLIPLYGCLGFFLPAGGLTRQGELYGLAVFFGFLYGAFQGYARALYAEIIPPNQEARWYALFSITDKSSSFVGPLVVGLISDWTGNIRYSFFFLVFMIWLAVPILMNVDVEQGRKDAQEYSKAAR